MTLPRPALLLLASGLLAVFCWPRRNPVKAQRILRISRVVPDLDRASAFYRDALGFRVVSRGPLASETLRALGLADTTAEEVVMRLGDTDIALVRFATPGQAYPTGSQSNDLWFQHLAIVVGDMDAACDQLARISGWQPISIGGPQLLPPSNGGVRAFKFRDPDGHPLELIWYPPRGPKAIRSNRSTKPTFIRIDHSALTVASTPRAVNFYRSLAFRVSARSLNHGRPQARLDGLPHARVQVTALQPTVCTKPGLELLAYQPSGRSFGPTSPTDVLTDWVTILINSLNGDRARAVQDPDGHRLLLVDQGSELPV